MENNFAFSLKGIDIVNSIIEAPTVSRHLTTFGFDIQFKITPNPNENLVTIFVDVKVKDQEKNDRLGQFSALFHFGVDDLKKMLLAKASNQMEVPQPLLSTLVGISASTLRGLMFGAFKGTFLHNAILPLVDIGSLQPELALSN